MNSKERHEFEVYDSFVNGWRRPHLPVGSFFSRLPIKFEHLVTATQNEMSEPMELTAENLPHELTDEVKARIIQSNKEITERFTRADYKLIVENPFSPIPTYIRYSYLNSTGEGLTTDYDENSNCFTLRATKNIDNLANKVVPSPPSIATAYRLFQIEKEYFRLREKHMQMLSNPNTNLAYIKHYANSNLQLLKGLARQLQEYHNEWRGKEKTQLEVWEREYVIFALKQYISKTILDMQELFEPYLKLRPLTEAEITERYFNNSPTPLLKAASTKSDTPQAEPQLQPEPISRWHRLFKSSKAAERVLLQLKEEAYVASDGKWIATPPLLTMIALYSVLLRRGYFKLSSTPATELAKAFNEQFQTSFGPKKWQPAGREDAANYQELFNMIPDYKD